MTDQTPIAFGGDPLDHAEHDRLDEALVARLEQSETSHCLVLHKGEILLDDEAQLYTLPPARLTRLEEPLFDPGLIFLGYNKYGDGIFAASVRDPGPFVDFGHFTHMREAAARMAAAPLALAGRAKALFDWHFRHGFCANCGTKTESFAAGVKRQCPSCEHEHFPRTDPVVIMLIHDGDRLLLARGTRFPERYFSVLAGFMEPGETVEDACRRESLEEVRLEIGEVAYQFSQPWPFPSSIMLGLFAKAESTDITIDESEIAEALWVSRDDLRRSFAGEHPDIKIPPHFTIAHQLMKRWLDG